MLTDTMSQKRLLFIMVILLLVGFFDSLYLTIDHYANASPICGIIEGCDKVTTSSYALFAGFPVALLGTLYYIIAIGFISLCVRKKSHRALEAFFYLSALASLMAIRLLALQVVVIHAICIYCVVTDSAVLTITWLSWKLLGGKGRLTTA